MCGGSEHFENAVNQIFTEAKKQQWFWNVSELIYSNFLKNIAAATFTSKLYCRKYITIFIIYVNFYFHHNHYVNYKYYLSCIEYFSIINDIFSARNFMPDATNLILRCTNIFVLQKPKPNHATSLPPPFIFLSHSRREP